MHKQPIKTNEVCRVVFREEIPFGQQNMSAVNVSANAENDAGNDHPAIAYNDEPPNVKEHQGKQTVNADLQDEKPL